MWESPQLFPRLGEEWENSFIVFPLFPQTVISTAGVPNVRSLHVGVARPLLFTTPPVQRFLLLSSVRRKRNDSVPVSMMWARSVIRSSSALQSRGFGNTVVHSENSKFVVTIMGLTQKLLLSESAGGGGAGLFLHAQNIFWANSHQNSHSPKIKMAADLAAAYIIDFIVFLAPQVGLEPTTLRLTAECSAIELLRSALKGILHYNVSRERDARQKF